jgi:5-methylcytosine-specific restriction protein A
MSWQYIETCDSSYIKKERAKARELRSSQWWRNRLGQGICYHCGQKFGKDALTMDHLIPLSRGGKTNKKNVVVSCKECNSHKKNLTVAEMILNNL